MSYPRLALLLAAILLGLSLAVSSQPMPTKQTPQPAVDNDFVQKEFGATCALVAGPPTFTADLDGDGVEDVVIAARCSNPLMDQAEHSYKVVDPYNSFYGFGDPKITTQFASEDPHGRGLSLLIIHGTGAEAWRSPAPKAKFIVINLPFKQLSVKKLAVRKKTIMAIYAQESGEGDGTISAVFWDGKKYRYRPLGSTME